MKTEFLFIRSFESELAHINTTFASKSISRLGIAFQDELKDLKCKNCSNCTADCALICWPTAMSFLYLCKGKSRTKMKCDSMQHVQTMQVMSSNCLQAESKALPLARK